MKLKNRLSALAIALACASSLSAATLSYTLSGSGISGSLGGTSFSNANWSITAIANSSAAQFLSQGAQGGAIWAPVWYQEVTPTISITGGGLSSPLTATLTASGSGKWFLESRDYSVFGPSTNQAAVGFFYSGSGAVMDGNGAYVDSLSSFNNLQSLGTFSGKSGFDQGSASLTYFLTSAGNLSLASGVSGIAGGTLVTSSVSVPEGGISVVSLGLALAGLFRLRRRLQIRSAA
ncbi:MAG: hypothetical protein ACO3JJ_13725 [Opitutaceae bacterium]